jgi:hypothetical protein
MILLVAQLGIKIHEATHCCYSWICYTKLHLRADHCMHSSTLHTSPLEVRLQFFTLVTLKYVGQIVSSY